MRVFRRGLYLVFGLAFAMIGYTLLVFAWPAGALFVGGLAILAIIAAFFLLAFTALRRGFR